MRTVNDPQQLKEYISNNIDVFSQLIELETDEVLTNQSGQIRNPEIDEDIEKSTDWSVHYRFPRQIKYLKNTAKLLEKNSRALRVLLGSSPDAISQIRELVTSEKLDQIARTLKRDFRCAKEPKLFKALVELAEACDYRATAENLKVEMIWAQALQLFQRTEMQGVRANTPKPDDPDEILREIDNLDVSLLDEDQIDLLDDTKHSLGKFLDESNVQVPPARTDIANGTSGFEDR